MGEDDPSPADHRALESSAPGSSAEKPEPSEPQPPAGDRPDRDHSHGSACDDPDHNAGDRSDGSDRSHHRPITDESSSDTGSATGPPDEPSAPSAGPRGLPLADLAGPLAAFHVATLVAVGVLGLHLGGVLGNGLAGLDTLVGIGIYLLLWAITHVTVGRWLTGAGGWPVDLVRFLARAAAWGGVTGTGFLWAILTAVVAVQVATEGPGAFTLTQLGFVIGIGVGVGGALAAVVGGAVGVVFGAIDYVLLAGGIRLSPPGFVPSGTAAPTDDGPTG